MITSIFFIKKSFHFVNRFLLSSYRFNAEHKELESLEGGIDAGSLKAAWKAIGLSFALGREEGGFSVNGILVDEDTVGDGLLKEKDLIGKVNYCKSIKRHKAKSP